MAIPSSGDDLIAAIYDVIIEPSGWDEVVNRIVEVNSNQYRPAIFTAIACPRPAPAPARHDPGLPGGVANTVGEKATCEKRNRHRFIALALAAMFALAGSAATAYGRERQ